MNNIKDCKTNKDDASISDQTKITDREKNKSVHRIIHFEWTIHLIREMFCLLINKIACKLKELFVAVSKKPVNSFKMNINNLKQRRFNQIQLQVICFLLFMLPASIILTTGIMIRELFPWLSQFMLIFLGWLTWTFLEYIAHRFWMHNKPARGEKQALSNHLYHHTHPTELKVTNADRILLLVTGILISIFGIYFHNYFILFVGFYWGFLSYTFMHVILHRKWAKNLFPGLLQNHILHHCKFTNKCFGVTVTWWDKIFATAAPRSYQISEKVISYYFGETAEKIEKEIHETLKISQNLYHN